VNTCKVQFYILLPAVGTKYNPPDERTAKPQTITLYVYVIGAIDKSAIGAITYRKAQVSRQHRLRRHVSHVISEFINSKPMTTTTDTLITHPHRTDRCSINWKY
jgi:hypothetical protein